MAVIHENLSFTILVMAAMSLLTFSITTQNTSATTSETRMLADLNPTDGAIADGRADYRERGNSVRLNVGVEDVSPNTTFTVEISGNTLGTITTSSFGTAELELNTNDGQVVPKILRGDLVQIFQGTELVLSGSFDGDGNIETVVKLQLHLTRILSCRQATPALIYSLFRLAMPPLPRASQ